MRFLLSLLFLFTAPNLAATKQRVDRIEVVSAGLFKSKVAKIGPVFYESYHFDHDWEVVPGAWSFEFWYDGRKLTEQKLTVLTVSGWIR